MADTRSHERMDGGLRIGRVVREPGKVSVRLSLNGEERDVWLAAPGGFDERPDFLAPLALLPAMVGGVGLDLPGESSPRLLKSLDRVQDIFHAWDRESYDKVSVSAKRRGDGSTDRPSGVACFFSGGVDSFYSVLKNLDEVTHLVLIHGFDLPLQSRELRGDVSRAMRAAADGMGKELIEVETNLRSFSDPVVSWEQYHGGALASIALLLQHRFRKVIIPSTHNYAHLFPWGSHPLLDSLWSTESLEFEHDGSDVTRAEKVARISQSDAAMKHLRVCFLNGRGAYNCGRCDKCVRTMVNLTAAKSLERCETLPNDLDLEAVANIPYEGERLHAWATENLKVVEQFGGNPELSQVLVRAIESSQADELIATQKHLENLATALRALRNSNSGLKARHAELQTRHTKLQTRHAKLENDYSKLANHYAGRRYKLADAAMKVLARLPGVGRLRNLLRR